MSTKTARLGLVTVLVSLALGGLVRGDGFGDGAADGVSFFHAEGRDLVSDSTGEEVAFRGVNLTGLEYGSFFDNPYPGTDGTNYFQPRPEDLDSLKAYGFNVVRVPFEWARLVTGWRPGDPLPSDLDATYLAILDDVVQMAGEREIYVVLDMHDFLKYWSGQSSQVCVDGSPEHQQMLAKTWQLLAAHYEDESAVLGYDIMNEPVRYEPDKVPPELCDSCDWITTTQSLVDAIRVVDTHHLIIIEGPNYSLASNWPVENGHPYAMDTVDPPRIVYSPHVFFDANNDSFYDELGEESGPLDGWQYYVRDRLMPPVDWSADYQVPILIGEANIPCTAAWADVLDYAYRTVFEPARVSVTVWHYIDPAHCPFDKCPLNLAACAPGHQMEVLTKYLGGPYTGREEPARDPPNSLIYDDAPVNPWDAGDGYWGDVGVVTECVDSPYDCFLRIEFGANYDGVKFMHRHGIDTRRFATLDLTLRLAGEGEQDFKIFTTLPIGDCESGPDPEYPPAYGERPTLQEFDCMVSPKPGDWELVKIPLDQIVDPTNPVINGIAFQNMGSVQEPFYITEVSLEPELLEIAYLPLTLKG